MIDIWQLLYHSSFITVGLLIWFKSDAFVEYFDLLGLDMAFGIRSYKKLRSEVSYPMSYPDYLLLKHNSFFIRLITCPLCSSVWVSVMISSSIGWQYLPFLIVVPLMLYNHLESKF